MRTRIELPLKRFLIAGHSLAGRKSRLWVIYLPESGAGFHTGSRLELMGLVGRESAQGLNYLVVNKPGLTPRGKDKDVFERSFRRRLRISDALTAIDQLIPAKDQMLIVGYSEGAYLAPELALHLGSRVRGLVMIGGGTRGWLREELANAYGREKAALKRQVARIEREKNSLLKWNGFSFATWNSYAADKTLQSLKRLSSDVPMLALLGQRDQVVDLKSTLLDLGTIAQTKDLRTVVFPRCGHSFTGHWRFVNQQVVAFLRPLL